MRLADLLSDMIASGASMEAVQAVVEAAKHQDDSKEQKRREQTAARVREHRARETEKKRNAGNAGNALQPLHALQDDPAETPAHVGAHADEITTKTTTKIISKTPPSEGQKPKRTSARSRIASDAQPEDRDREIANEFGLDQLTFRHEWSGFRSHHVAKGSTMANWHEAWRKWLLGWVERGRQPAPNGLQARAGPVSRPPKPSAVALWTEDIFDDQRHDPSAETRRPALAYRG